MVDVSDYYVTPGLIDIHSHFDAQGAPLNLNPGPQCAAKWCHYSSRCRKFRLEELRAIQDESYRPFEDSRVLAFLNIVGAGMYRNRRRG